MVRFGSSSSNSPGFRMHSPSHLCSFTDSRGVTLAHNEGTWSQFNFPTLFLHEDILTMGQIPLSFPSAISPLAAADLFQIYSSRTEMRFWPNEYKPVYVCSAVSSILYPKSVLHPSPSRRTPESIASTPLRYSYEEQKI